MVQSIIWFIWTLRKPNREDVWSPTVLGMQKRDLLKDVLRIFGTSS